MARVPKVIRNQTAAGSIFQPNAVMPSGWALVAQSAAEVEGIVRPMALRAQAEEGASAVYRDDDGNLKVDERSMLGGEYAEAHNNAAFAAFLGKSSIDVRQNLSELSTKHKFDPAAFKEASDAYLKGVAKNAPPILRNQIEQQGMRESSAMFDGLRRSQIARTEKTANADSLAARSLAAQDYVSLIQGGAQVDDPRVVAKLQEIEEITAFRANAGYIGESQAESEAFMTALRGDSKAMRLQREIDELGGIESLSDDERARLTSAVRDMDIDPGTREKLHRLLDGQIKRIDATSFVNDLTSDDYWAVLERNEKGGTKDGVPRFSDGSKRSSASGRYGLLDGTFVDMVHAMRRQGKADWASGMSDAQILSRKGDKVIERAAAETYRAQLQSVLAKEGLPINRGNEYVMWVLGEGGGAKALKSDPAAPAASVIGNAAIKANSWQNRTIGSVVSMLQKRGGGPKSSDIAGMRNQIDGIADPEVRAEAQRQAARWYQSQRAAEAEAAEAYALRIAAGDAVTRQEIIGDQSLDDGSQASLLSSLNAAEQETNDVSQTIADMNDPETFIDMNQVKTRNQVDKAYTALRGGEDPLSQTGMRAAAHILERTESLPKSMVGALTGAMSSGDPSRIMTAMNFAEQATRQNPGALNAYKTDGKRLNQDIAEYRHEIRMGRGAEGAAAIMAERRMPENVEKRKNRVGEAKKISEALTPDMLADAFNDQLPGVGLFQTDPIINPEMQDRMMMMLRRETQEQFIDSGDKDAAQARALAEVGRVFGVTNASGTPVVMVHPPEQHYPAVNGDHEWMYEQLQDDVSFHVFGETAGQELPDAPGPGTENATLIPREQIHLQSDAETQADIETGRAPSYVVWYRHENKLDRMPQRWHGDPAPYQSRRDDVNAGREADVKATRTGRRDQLIEMMDVREP